MKIVNMDYGEGAEKVPGFLLWQVSKLWQRQLNAALLDLNISSTQAIILGNVVRMEGQGKQANQILIAGITKIDPMTVSQAIRTLEKKKLVKRTPSKGDKRAFVISATEKGFKVTAQALERMIQAHLAFFKPLEKELDGFAAQLAKLVMLNEG